MKPTRKRDLSRLMAVLLLVALVLSSAAPAVAADDASTDQDELAMTEDSASDNALDDYETELDWFELGITALDVTVLRPLGTLSTLGGFVFFVASAPLVAPGGHLETTWDIFVFNSYDYTFMRPIGEL